LVRSRGESRRRTERWILSRVRQHDHRLRMNLRRSRLPPTAA
jgi:hypothetical protein